MSNSSPNQPLFPEQQPVPPTTYSNTAPTPPAPSEYIAPPSVNTSVPSMPPSGMLPPPGIPPYPVMPPPTRKKSSRLWLWITLSIVGCFTLLGCGICGILGYLGYSYAQSDTFQSINTVNSYYQALERMDYASASSYVSPDAHFSIQQVNDGTFFSKGDFASNARLIDQQNGAIETFTASLVSLGNGLASVDVNVTRTDMTYRVQLSLNKTGKTWQIMGADGI